MAKSGWATRQCTASWCEGADTEESSNRFSPPEDLPSSGPLFTIPQDYPLDVTPPSAYPYTYDSSEEQVTVAIGVLAEGGDMAIIGSDLRASFPRLPPNETCGKAWILPRPFNCGVAAAGTLRDCQPFVDHLWGNIKKLGKSAEIFNEQLESAIDDARFRVWKRRVDWKMRMTYCTTLAEFKRGKIPSGKLDPLLLKACEVLASNTPLNVQAIIAGFIRGRGIFYRTSLKDPIECSSTPGIYAIGLGGTLAMNHLNKREQNTGCSLARSLLHVAEALDEAAKEPTGTVGKPSRILVMAADGSMAQFLPDHPTLIGWKKAYAGRDSTASLQNSKLSEIQAKGMARRQDHPKD